MSASIERRFDRALGATAAFGAATFGLTVGFTQVQGYAVAAATALGFFAAAALRRRWRGLGRSGENAIAVLAGLTVPPALLQEIRVAAALAFFLIFAQLAKVIGPREERDERVILLVSVVHIAVAAAETSTPVVAPLLLAHLVAAIAALSLREIRACARLRAGGPSPAGPDVELGLRHRVQVLACAAGTIAVAVVAFPLMPRVGMRLAPGGRAAQQRVSGFSDSIDLARTGKIDTSDEIAFRAIVRERGALPAVPYWRGRALDAYDGSTWYSSAASRRLIIYQSGRTGERGTDHDFARASHGMAGSPGATEVDILYEPANTWTLLALPNTVKFSFRGRVPEVVSKSVVGTFATFESRANGATYTVFAYPGRPLPVERAPNGDDFSRPCLAVPVAVDSARVRALAQQTLAARNATGLSRRERARVLEDHLGTRPFLYTLDARRTPGAEPVTDFLFATREGHCELFASALAIMLRTVGIPSRVVTGYRGGEYRDWAGTYSVTQGNAHAWVEALVEEGWVTFDPTPDDPGGSALSSVGRSLRGVRDWLELQWLARIVTFDTTDQTAAARRLRGVLGRLEDAWAPRDGGGSVPAVAVATILLALGAGLVWRDRHAAARFLARLVAFALGRPAPEEDAQPVAPAARALESLLHVLARKGVARQPQWTARELAEEAITRLGEPARPLAAIARRYDEARWGDRPLGAEDEAALAEVVKKLEAAPVAT